ncbi:predicted protein [Histoplasma capsulatum H143]|uniref:Uncharacterized protein n=1 Tax=Ajellomyces capsulatus (strain H143) TaxID=544712 RepID=C6H805_AJECH|nr:predicted protein [Histoplasma capsulatum H143]
MTYFCVLEVGYPESQAQLEYDASWWLEASRGHVGAVITIGIERTKDKLPLGRWEMGESSRPTGQNLYKGGVPQLIENACVQSTSEADGAITIPFEKIFLRSPTSQESDLV